MVIKRYRIQSTAPTGAVAVKTTFSGQLYDDALVDGALLTDATTTPD